MRPRNRKKRGYLPLPLLLLLAAIGGAGVVEDSDATTPEGKITVVSHLDIIPRGSLDYLGSPFDARIHQLFR